MIRYPSLLLLTLALPLLKLQANTADARSFIWQQANIQATAATTPDDYLKAAQSYNRLINDGVANGTIFANLGSLLVLTGDGINAAAAFERAERYLGATPETRAGMTAALSLHSAQRQTDHSWTRAAFFWHYGIPCETRAWAALAGWTIFWLGALLRLLSRQRAPQSSLRSLADTSLLAGGLVMLVFTASTTATLIQERHDHNTWATRTLQIPHADQTEGPTP